ncbi:hypothetical protein ACBE110449_10445 [Acinetobacter bereziniae]|uniref:hypothetical protein n=1 Tax=Acinetobacter bereziniae TaxID=106648 RepID=UPI003B29A8CD
MNDFFLALNGTSKYEEIEVRQVLVSELDQWAQFAEPVRLKLNLDYSHDKLFEIFESLKFQILMICSLTSDVTIVKPDILNNKNKLIELFKVVIDVNYAYFIQEINNKNISSKNHTWFDSFQYLISKGHRHSDILNYSFGAFVEYLKAAQRNERNTLLTMGNAMRVSYHADKNAYSKYVDNMKKA